MTVSARISAGTIRESRQMPDESPRSTVTPPALQRAVHHASEWLASLDTRPVGARASLETLRGRLNLPLP